MNKNICIEKFFRFYHHVSVTISRGMGHVNLDILNLSYLQPTEQTNFQ